MRVNKYIRVYETLCPQDKIAPDDSRRDAIIAEMRGIQKAKTNRDAAKVIEWWGWNSDQELISYVMRARRLLNELKK